MIWFISLEISVQQILVFVVLVSHVLPFSAPANF